ncbi:MAG: hypothetical protein HQK99_16080 [Nitrospirae bacterium]|nr:hypothetical protein [Nitrospirota bacterium]
MVTEYALSNASSGPNGITSGPDGNIWFTECDTGKIGMYSLSRSLSDSSAATAAFKAAYNQYASWFGSTSGGIGAGTSGSSTYYYQWYTNGAALVAWTDGYMYTYYNGTSYPFGVKWE